MSRLDGTVQFFGSASRVLIAIERDGRCFGTRDVANMCTRFLVHVVSEPSMPVPAPAKVDAPQDSPKLAATQGTANVRSCAFSWRVLTVIRSRSRPRTFRLLCRNCGTHSYHETPAPPLQPCDSPKCSRQTPIGRWRSCSGGGDSSGLCGFADDFTNGVKSAGSG